MFSDFQSVLFPPLERNRGELKGNTWWPFPWHELGNLLERTCLFGFYGITSKDWQKDMVAIGLPEAFAGKLSHIQKWVSVGVTLGSLSFAMEIITIKSLSLKLRGWFFQRTPTQCPVAFIMGYCSVGHCWGNIHLLGLRKVKFWYYLMEGFDLNWGQFF